MNNPQSQEKDSAAASREEMVSALFANLVLQYTNMALIFLGRMPHPETGQVLKDLEHARYFIDQLEMLEAKTKGNLNKQEETLLKQSLTTLRMAFVEAASEEPAKPARETALAPEAGKTADDEPAEAKASEEESKKKFSKKY